MIFKVKIDQKIKSDNSMMLITDGWNQILKKSTYDSLFTDVSTAELTDYDTSARKI
jgi:hypothetical protein